MEVIKTKMIKIYDGRYEFYQWDLNRKLIIDDATVTEVHFCNKTSDCSLVVAVQDGGIVDVPNILLQTDWTINVYLYCGDCYTKEHTTFKVNKRSKPDDYVYTETEVKRWEALEQRVNTTLDSVAEAEQARNEAEQERATAEQARAEEFDIYSAEANSLIDKLDNYYVPTVDNHERRITQLEHHLSNDYFVTDASTEYNKVVPVGACPYAEVSQIGGMTYKAKNLIPFPYTNEVGKSITRNGVTFTVREDGGISVVGTPTSSATSEIHYFNDETSKPFVQGKQYCISGGVAGVVVTAHITPIDSDIKSTAWIESNVNNQAGQTKAIPDGYKIYRVILYVPASTTALNTVVYPMLNEGSVALPYEQYFDGLRDTAVSELVSEGANLLDMSQALNEQLVDNGDGTYTMTHNGGNYRFANNINIDIPLNIPFVFYAETVDGTSCTFGFGSDTEWYSNTASTNSYVWIRTSTPEKPITKVRIFMTVGDDGKYCKFKEPRIILGEELLPYTPYRADAVDRFPISAELRAFLADKGYGRGIEGYPNYIDFDRKVFVQNTYCKVFDGTERIIVTGETNYNYEQYSCLVTPKAFSNTEAIQLITSHMTPAPRYRVYDRKILNVISAHADYIQWTDEHMTADEMKAKLKAWYDEGKPLIAEYRLAEPIITDISEYLTDENIIEVEGGGTIRAINEYNQAAPTSITYLLKEGSI